MDKIQDVIPEAKQPELLDTISKGNISMRVRGWAGTARGWLAAGLAGSREMAARAACRACMPRASWSCCCCCQQEGGRVP
jgi:hypothetical protein